MNADAARWKKLGFALVSRRARASGIVSTWHSALDPLDKIRSLQSRLAALAAHLKSEVWILSPLGPLSPPGFDGGERAGG